MRAARFFPFLDTLKTYTTRDFRADFMAALTVTPMAIPQAMAYALIAGVHPQYGIYACMLPVIVAVSYEINRFVGRHDNAFTRFLTKPGMWMQKFTTNEPDDSMIEVAIEALNAVIPEEEGADQW